MCEDHWRGLKKEEGDQKKVKGFIHSITKKYCHGLVQISILRYQS
jgi:hypothetical protein